MNKKIPIFFLNKNNLKFGLDDNNILINKKYFALEGEIWSGVTGLEGKVLSITPDLDFDNNLNQLKIHDKETFWSLIRLPNFREDGFLITHSIFFYLSEGSFYGDQHLIFKIEENELDENFVDYLTDKDLEEAWKCIQVYLEKNYDGHFPSNLIIF